MAAQTRIIIRFESPDQLREFMQQEDLDINCGGPQREPDGGLMLEAYVPPEVATRLRKSGYRVETDQVFGRRTAARRSQVGEGDRFQGGLIPPRGVGRKE